MKNYTFIFITGAYNTASYAERYFKSIFSQTYKNYNIWYVCDGCTDGTYDIAKKYLRQEDTLTVNPYSNRGPMASTLKNLSHHKRDESEDTIYIYLDGDDWLCDNKVLEYLNDEFQNEDTWMVYNGASMVTTKDLDTPSEERFGVESAYTKEEYMKGLRGVYYWKGWHLKAWRAPLWDYINHSRYKNLFHAGDRAWFYDLFDLCGFNRVKPLEKPLMVYNLHNPLNHHKVHESAEKEIQYISTIPPLKKLKSLTKV